MPLGQTLDSIDDHRLTSRGIAQSGHGETLLGAMALVSNGDRLQSNMKKFDVKIVNNLLFSPIPDEHPTSGVASAALH
jgi:hypothetical protein